MDEYDQNALDDIRKKLHDIENEIKQKDSFGDDAGLSPELKQKVESLEQKMDDLAKRQATSHKILTVLQQQVSGLKVGLNNLEDLLEGEEPAGKEKGRRQAPGDRKSSKTLKYVTFLVFIVLAFIFANRWISGYLDKRWHGRQEAPGVYESLDEPQESTLDEEEPRRPYEEDIQSKIDEKLKDISPEEKSAEPVIQEEIQTPVAEPLQPGPEIRDIFVPNVLILNGCGVSGIAAQLEDYLSRNGIRVVDSKNADNFNYPSTVIYSTSDHPDDHVWLELIGVNPKTVKRLNQERENANTVIILGKDYKKLSIY